MRLVRFKSYKRLVYSDSLLPETKAADRFNELREICYLLNHVVLGIDHFYWSGEFKVNKKNVVLFEYNFFAVIRVQIKKKQ
jgi:hypothetical protein